MIAAIGRQAFHRDMAEHVQGAQLRAAAGRISNRKSTDRCDDGIMAGADAPEVQIDDLGTCLLQYSAYAIEHLLVWNPIEQDGRGDTRQTE